MSRPSKRDKQLSPSFLDTTLVWCKIGIISFGGPAAQIALMHKEIVEERNWLSEKQFLNGLNFCMLLPGPEAMQLAIYTGWRTHGTFGGLIAGLLFLMPGALVIMVLAVLYSMYGQVPTAEALLYGIKAAVLVIVFQALLRVASKTLSYGLSLAVAGLAFIGIFFLSIPYPMIILIAAATGAVFMSEPTENQEHIEINISLLASLRTTILWLAIWLAPFAFLWFLDGQDFLFEVGKFFSTLAATSFGGAYAALAFMAQDVVLEFDWLSADEMLDALGLAETTPGPLILVTQFVGFIAGFNEGGFAFGFGAAVVTLWAIFVPCFLFIFVGAPYIEWISSQPRLQGALAAITAAVVGVILNLSVWFALHVLFGDITQYLWGFVTFWLPHFSTIEWFSLGLFAFGSILTFLFGLGAIRMLLSVSLLSAVLSALN